MPHAAFTALMTMSVAVRSATTAQTQEKNLKLVDYDATADSPISALIQPMSTSARQDPFVGRWPEATHRMYCAASITLEADYLLSWVDADSNTHWYGVLGDPENAGGQAHHHEVPLIEIEAPPSGVT